MAIRARRLADARSQAKNNAELAWWVFMRLSGSFLVVLTFVHLFQNYIIRSEKAADYDFVVAQYSNISERLFLFALLSLGLLHGVNDLRYGLDDWTTRNPQLRFWLKALAYTLVAAILVFGTLALFVGTPGAIPEFEVAQ